MSTPTPPRANRAPQLTTFQPSVLHNPNIVTSAGKSHSNGNPSQRSVGFADPGLAAGGSSSHGPTASGGQYRREDNPQMYHQQSQQQIDQSIQRAQAAVLAYQQSNPTHYLPFANASTTAQEKANHRYVAQIQRAQVPLVIPPEVLAALERSARPANGNPAPAATSHPSSSHGDRHDTNSRGREAGPSGTSSGIAEPVQHGIGSAPAQNQPPSYEDQVYALSQRAARQNEIPASGSNSHAPSGNAANGPSVTGSKDSGQGVPRPARDDQEDTKEEAGRLTQVKTDEDDEDYYDELGEQEEEDLEYQPATVKPVQTQGQIDAGITAGCLTPYNESRQTCKSLDELIQYGDIDLDPDYQREIVWPDARKSGLIDSLFRGVYVPPVLFAVRVDADGNEKRVCTIVDGKQRLSSISYFMQGGLPWIPTAGTHEGKHLWYLLPPQHRNKRAHEQLSPNLKKLFNMKLLTVAEFRNLPDEIERDIFQRVQLGMALSPAEKLRAMDTPYVRYIHATLQKHVQGPEGIVHYYNNWERARGRDFQNVGIMLMMLEAYPRERFGTDAKTLKTFLNRADGVERGLRKRVDTVLELYVEILRDHQPAAIATVPAKLSPIEFAFISLIIFEFRKAPTADIARLIGEMRVWIRTIDTNVRTNSVTIRNLYSWLAGRPKIRAKRPRDEDEDESSGDDNGRASRRQRRAASDELDEDYHDDGATASQMRHDRSTRRNA